MEKGSFDRYYDKYSSDGGAHDKANFVYNIQVYFRLPVTTSYWWDEWVRFIGSEQEAKRYENSVDEIW